MPPQTSTAPEVAQIEIKIDGADLAQTAMDMLFEVEVETSLYLPSMFSMSFYDDTVTLIDDDTFKQGKGVEIKLKQAGATTYTTVFKGEITAIEPNFSIESAPMLVIRGYDRSHRLHRGTKNKVFVQVKDSDIVSQIASAAGLTASVDATTEVYKHVFQYGVSDWAFIHERARRNGYEVYVDDRTLYFKKIPTSSASAVASLAWGLDLVYFKPRLTLAKQVEKVTVKGWDPKTKQAIVGSATTSSSSPVVGIGNWGGALAQTAFSSAEVIELRHPVRTQAEAEKMAQAMLDEINAGFLQADGSTLGNPVIKPGAKVEVKKIGTKFSGKYVVTTARHVYDTRNGYNTNFTVQGARAQTLADLIDQSMVEQRSTQMWGGVVIGVVTNNNDPDNMARVKVKFPWLDDTLESNWARVTGVGAGNTHGFLWLPEVNDEVLIAFEHGDFDYPYVIGSLWNGTDAMPETTSAAVVNGKIVMRTIKTTAGHIIRMTETSSAKKIEIIDSTAQTKVTLDETNKKITIESTGDIEIKATGNMDLKATGNMNLKSTGNMDLKADGNISVGGINVKLNASAQLEAKGAIGTVEASGPMNVKGAVVNIN